MTTVNIEIDGKKVEARNGSMLIEAADEAGINIPRFCYHKKLSIAANCRMCLVEVEKAAKPLPACATPVTDGMKIFTRSPKAINAQKGVMEFLLINHPLDCPICDQGGECELQDVAMGYGGDESRFYENKRIVAEQDIGPLIATDMTRCIHCTRCVRFGDEIAGVRELGATGRGEHMEIGTYVANSVSSEVSGNVIDLCPVGALTSKPFRYSARAWELGSASGISGQDCIGSNLIMHTHNNEVLRVVPQDNEAINEAWLSDRDRFAYEGTHSDERLTTPMIKVDGEWKETDWNTALENAARGLQGVVDKFGAEQLGCLLSASSTTEELFLAQKLMRGIGSNNIDHRLRQIDFSDQHGAAAFPWLGQPIEELDNLDSALLIGSNIRKDQPIAALRLRKASMNGAEFCAVNPVDYEFNFEMASSVTVSPSKMVEALAAIAKAVLTKSGISTSGATAVLIDAANVNDSAVAIADKLYGAEKSAVILGNYAASHPQASTMRAIAAVIAEVSESKLGFLSEGANSAGAWLAGAIPHRHEGNKKVAAPGLSSKAMIDDARKGYLLLGVEPSLDCANGQVAEQAIGNADYVVALSAYRSQSLESCADVMLPISPLIETSGTLVNAEGCWQSFNGAVAPKGDSRPAWKVLRVLGNLFDIEGFDYLSSEDVINELREHCASLKPTNKFTAALSEDDVSSSDGVQRIAECAMYAVDAQVRRSASLQQTADAVSNNAVHVCRATAEANDVVDCERVLLKQGDHEVELPLVINDRVAANSLLVYSGLPQTSGLAADFSPIIIQKAN